MNERRCRADTTAGAPCRAFAPAGREVCRVHDPELAEAVQAARSRGAAKANTLRRIRGRRSKLATVSELVRFTADLIHKTVEGELAVDVARCAFYGLSLQKGLVELSDLERRIVALEAAAAQTSKTGKRVWSA